MPHTHLLLLRNVKFLRSFTQKGSHMMATKLQRERCPGSTAKSKNIWTLTFWIWIQREKESRRSRRKNWMIFLISSQRPVRLRKNPCWPLLCQWGPQIYLLNIERQSLTVRGVVAETLTATWRFPGAIRDHKLPLPAKDGARPVARV